MRKYAGLDVSLKTTSICIVDEAGVILKEVTVETDPKIVAAALKSHGRLQRVGLEAGSLAAWLCEGLHKARLPAIAIEARQAHGVLKARNNKTDRNDALGIAHLMRTSLYRAVHIKSKPSQYIRALLSARKLLVTKALDLEAAVIGLLSGFGFKPGKRSAVSFEDNVVEILRRAPELKGVIEPLMAARAAVRAQFDRLHQRLVETANADPVCVRLMTAPGVGPVVALTYRQVIDDPSRFTSSRSVAAHLGLTPRVRQSGPRQRLGQITHCGDKDLRTALVTAATFYLNPRTRASDLKVWAAQIATRNCRLKTLVAIARRLAVILHRMWADGTDFRRFAQAA